MKTITLKNNSREFSIRQLYHSIINWRSKELYMLIHNSPIWEKINIGQIYIHPASMKILISRLTNSPGTFWQRTT
ncbi:hypothetical protein SAMN05192589_111171 [Paracidovorax valerianellae]|uniref:Uncharacterized protein n=1 Tax=Paracidovorax valerianellae TaxID=187868 RepID=A0A1G6ZQA1_9BURK|nr:hypothetical protein SAMN05192589_111171 [Paracidovorax valerianellae]